MTPQDPMVEVIERLKKRISYIESVLSEIQMLNALGKTLKIDEAIHAAIDITE
jgi:hypothetical protein